MLLDGASLILQAENVYNHSLHFKRIIGHVEEPMSYAESVASSAVLNFLMY